MPHCTLCAMRIKEAHAESEIGNLVQKSRYSIKQRQFILLWPVLRMFFWIPNSPENIYHIIFEFRQTWRKSGFWGGCLESISDKNGFIAYILTDSLVGKGIPKKEWAALHGKITIRSFVSHVGTYYPITLLILTFQLPLNSMAVSRHLCDIITPYMAVHQA